MLVGQQDILAKRVQLCCPAPVAPASGELEAQAIGDTMTPPHPANPSFPGLDAEARFALQSVHDAAQLCSTLMTHGQSCRRLDKPDTSPVTVVDFAVQALVAQRLEQAFPEATLVAEEDSALLRASEADLAAAAEAVGRLTPRATPEAVCAWIDRGTGTPRSRFWTLDPIDGTKGLLRGDQYAVALALIEDGQVLLAALACPRLSLEWHPSKNAPGCILTAGRGQGTWIGADGNRQLRRLRVSPQASLTQARVLRSFEAAHTDIARLDQLVDHLGIAAPPLRMDSQVKYAMLAAGQGELIFRIPSPVRPGYQERIWDHAAGSLLVQEAGGMVTDLRGAALDFGAGRTLRRNVGVLASNGQLHPSALQAIAAVGADRPIGAGPA